MNALEYRPDIDGLRAVAVLLVVAFHAFPVAVPGGFIGVDVFFVISGYLISGVIISRLRGGDFSFVDFYAKRCRRIIPGLGLVLLFVWITGYFFLLPQEFSLLGKHVSAGAAFVSNIVLWNEAGYFDLAAELKPLLHLWSLGIEEQFYLTWPFLLVFFYKKNCSLRILFFCLLAFSFATDIFQSYSSPSGAFYLLPSRFWELLIGAGLVFRQSGTTPFQSSKYVGCISIFAICLLASGAFFINSSLVFPGAWALVPVIASVCFIYAGPTAWLNRTVLSSRPFVFVGLISYPLYLWHWPMLSLLRLTNTEQLSAFLRVVVVLLSFLLATLTFYFVEKPIQKRLLPFRTIERHGRRVLFATLILLLSIVTVGILTGTGRLSARSEKQVASLAGYGWRDQNTESEFWEKGCFLLDTDSVEKFERNECQKNSFPQRPVIFILGDSHAAYLSLGLKNSLEKYKINLIQLSAGWCTPLDISNPEPRCAAINKYIFDTVNKARPKVVVIFANYMQYHLARNSKEKDFESFIATRAIEILDKGIDHVIVLGQMPTWHENLSALLGREFLMQHKPIPPRISKDIDQPIESDTRFRSQLGQKNISFISLRDGLCNNSGCVSLVGSNLSSDLIVFDAAHMTLHGAEYVSETVVLPAILKVFAQQDE